MERTIAFRMSEFEKYVGKVLTFIMAGQVVNLPTGIQEVSI